MTQPNLELYIFYQDKEKLRDAISNIDDSLVQPVDLNALPIPPELRIESMSMEENRAALAEYLGHLAIRPKQSLVGLFPDSVPREFSREWARTSGAFEIFLPEIDFSTLLDLRYREGKLYGLEFTKKNPMLGGQGFRGKFAETFAINHFASARHAPLKGTIVVERRIFEEYQAWLLRAIRFLIQVYESPVATSGVSLGEDGRDRSGQELSRRFSAGLTGEIERAAAYFFSKRIDDGDKIRIGDMVRQRMLNRPIAEAAAKARRGGDTVIVTFASMNYLEPLNNWSHAMRRAEVNNWAVLALDDNVLELLRGRGVPTARVECKKDFSDIWVRRMEAIRDLLVAGVNVIHSDLDAIWLKDPRALFQGATHDIIASQGTYWPRAVHAKWGFVLCCGLIYYRSTNRVIDLVERMLDDFAVAKKPDDQVTLNTLLAEDEIRWSVLPPTYTKSLNGLDFTCSRHWITGKGRLYNVALLPHHQFQRSVMQEELAGAYVVHPYSEKSGESIMQVLKANNLVVEPPQAKRQRAMAETLTR